MDFERGARTPYRSSLTTLRAALEQAGIEFILEDDRGVGVWLRPQAPTLGPGEQAVVDLEKILDVAVKTDAWNAALQDSIEACMDRLVDDSCAIDGGGKPDGRKSLHEALDRVEARARDALTWAHGAEGDFWLVVLDLVLTHR
ncbi:MAG TPA: hypothetical protein VKZ79_06670 [Alphaproteobacteria bacterium]|nr:hypothetical protein [Alphaproteobacteria bacterium]